MAHFAELDENNIVLRVIVVSNDDCKDANGNESEEVGIEFCKKLAKNAHYFPNKPPENGDFDGGVWKQTSYNGNFRKYYAGVGYKYIPEKDVFVPPKPGDNWIWDDTEVDWVEVIEDIEDPQLKEILEKLK